MDKCAKRGLDAVSKWYGKKWEDSASKKLASEFNEYLTMNCECDPDLWTIRMVYSRDVDMFLMDVLSVYGRTTGIIPHVVCMESEPSVSLWEMAKNKGLCHTTQMSMERRGSFFGTVNPRKIMDRIRSNTCIVSTCGADRYSGIIHGISEISKVTSLAGVPLFCDISSVFGRAIIRIDHMGADLFCARLDGCMNVGVLIIRKSLISGYGLDVPLNVDVPIFAYGYEMFRFAIENRVQYMSDASRRRISMIKKIKDIGCDYVENYVDDSRSDKIWIISPVDDRMIIKDCLMICMMGKRILDEFGMIDGDVDVSCKYIPNSLLPHLVKLRLCTD